VLFIAGDQVPVIPLVEVVGKAAKTAPEHIAGTGSKVAISGFTTTVKLVVAVAHCPIVGVKVYVVVVELSTGGDQVPVTPLEDVVGKGAKASPEHIGGIAGRKIATKGFTIIVLE
jgi:hypothetical protein